MSVQAMAWALDHRQTGPLPAGTRLVLVSLADYADPTGRGAYPSAETLAHRLGVTTRSVRRSLALLEDVQLIRRGDQRLVAHLRVGHRPVVWTLAIDGQQVRLDFDAPNGAGPADVKLGEEPYDRDRHGLEPVALATASAVTVTPDELDDSPPAVLEAVTHTSPLEPVDNLLRGDTGGSYGVTPASPKPPTKPTHSPTGWKVTKARARDLERPVPREPGARVRSLGLTDRNCPTCGQPVYRTHRCRASALSPITTTADELRSQLGRAPAAPSPQLELELIEAPRDVCEVCGRVAVIVEDTGLCARCVVAIGRVGPHPHPLEDERPQKRLDESSAPPVLDGFTP